jgi:glycosyltransferase involved in cell wall biosynthesis
VLTVHDMLPLDRPLDFPLGKRRLLPGPYLASVRDADVLLCVSRATEDRLCSYVPAARRRTAVVPLATSASLRNASPVPVARLAGVAFGLVVADPSPRKNLALLARSWARVCARRPEAVLAVAGPPGWGRHRGHPGDDPLGALSAGGRVLRLGFLSDGELRWCYEQARVVLCPSLLEGFGLPALEATELAARVLTSDDPALVEASGSGARHLPSDRPDVWADAILASWDEGSRPGEAARAATRTWSNVAEETVCAACARA